MEYTKKQRKEIYKKAYEKLSEVEYGYVCNIIKEITGKYVTNPEIEFPELYIFSVGGIKWLTDTYGYGEADYYQRQRNQKLTILGFAIAMCN